MQKVIMLPTMPSVESAVFTRRLVAFHQTLAPLGSRTKAHPAVGVVWHEATAGRSAEDVASAFIKCLQSDSYRDAKHSVFWCDNCAGKNNNWTLDTALCFAVNKTSGPDKITLRYLERGHTLMSVDSFHASVEKSIKQKVNIYDFSDFLDAVNKNGVSVEMQPADFADWPNGQSSAKFTRKPLLKDVSEVQFRRGESKMFWKRSFEEPIHEEGEFLKKNVARCVLKSSLPINRTTARGICSSKKADVAKLCPLMPANRTDFWKTLPENAKAVDLLVNFE